MLNKFKGMKILSISLFTLLLLIGFETQIVKAADGIIENPIVGDLDGDGQVNSIDYDLMQRYLLGSIDSFPVENRIIKSISDINVTINQYDLYELPSTVSSIMQDGSEREIAVKWNENINTSICKTYNLIGAVDGYKGKVNLTLIINPSIEKIEDKKFTLEFNSKYVLPDKVIATLGDGSTREVDIKWNKVLDTSVEGVFTFEGSVESYTKKIIYTITIEGSTEKGNTNGNLFNEGVFSEKDGYTYYANPLDEGRLYKMDKYGDGEKVDSETNTTYINVVGDWIYYKGSTSGYVSTMYKIKVDGTEKTKLTEKANMGSGVCFITSYNGEIYYSEKNNSTIKLYKIDLKGVKSTLISKFNSRQQFIIDDGWVFYKNDSDSDRLYKIRIDGTENTKLYNDINVNNFELVDEEIIFSTEAYLKKINIKTGNVKVLSYDNNLIMNDMVIYKGLIYFTKIENITSPEYTQTLSVYKSDLEGNNKTLIIDYNYK